MMYVRTFKEELCMVLILPRLQIANNVKYKSNFNTSNQAKQQSNIRNDAHEHRYKEKIF